MTFFASSELDVTLEVDSTRFRVAHFGCNYAINQIPQARCMLEIGRDALTGITPSRVNTDLAKLKKMSKCKVIFQGYGEASPGVPWPDQETVIFEGYITGTGFEKSGGSAQYTVDIVHWLYDLDCTSAVSKYSHVSNNSRYTFQAIINPASSAGGDTVVADGDQGVYSLFASDITKVITSTNISQDFWGLALKSILVQLANSEHIVFSTKLTACLGEAEGNNSLALNALARIEGVGGNSCDLDNSCYAPKLQLTSPDLTGVPEEVVRSIQTAVGCDLVQSFAGQTAWSKLLSYGSDFVFSVIPQAERALVVPLVLGSRETYCKSISANDYDFISLPSRITRPLRAVGVWASLESTTGLVGVVNPANPAAAPSSSGIIGLGGCFAPDNESVKDGMIRLVTAPMWLDNVSSDYYAAARTSGIKAEEAVSTATTPLEVPARGISGLPDGKTTDDIFLTTKDMYDKYAHTFYILEALRGRMGSLSGKLRFDISPGSTVRVEVASEQHLDNYDNLGGVFIANVLGVSININAESGKAGTGFMLSHTRTEEENASDMTSIDGHPLYTTVFSGAPLIPALAFVGESDGCCTGTT